LPDVALAPGSHLFAEPGEVHEGVAEEGTEFLVFAGRDRQDAGGVGVVILLAQACLEVAQEAAVATASSIWLPAARQRLRGDVRLLDFNKNSWMAKIGVVNRAVCALNDCER